MLAPFTSISLSQQRPLLPLIRHHQWLGQLSSLPPNKSAANQQVQAAQAKMLRRAEPELFYISFRLPSVRRTLGLKNLLSLRHASGLWDLFSRPFFLEDVHWFKAPSAYRPALPTCGVHRALRPFFMCRAHQGHCTFNIRSALLAPLFNIKTSFPWGFVRVLALTSVFLPSFPTTLRDSSLLVF